MYMYDLSELSFLVTFYRGLRYFLTGPPLPTNKLKDTTHHFPGSIHTHPIEHLFKQNFKQRETNIIGRATERK